MQNISLQIPDSKYSFFMELVQSLGFVRINTKSNALTEEQIGLLEDERRKLKEDPSYSLDWETARKSLKAD